MPDKTPADYLRDAMDRQGIADPVVRAGIPAIASAEGGLTKLEPERGYAHTANSRIRQVFGERVAHLNDAELDQLKADDRRWFNFIYSGDNSVGKQLGNRPGTDDGYDWRGRGPIQFTGRANYELYARLAGHPEVMQNPDLVNDPEIGAGMTVAYIVHRYKGGGFDALMACVGNNTPDIAARKRAAFQRFMASGEFSAGKPAAPAEPPPASATAEAPALRRRDQGDAVKALQQALIDAGFGCGKAGADGDFGGDTEAAMAAFQQAHGLPVTRVADAATRAALGFAG